MLEQASEKANNGSLVSFKVKVILVCFMSASVVLSNANKSSNFNDNIVAPLGNQPYDTIAQLVQDDFKFLS